MPPSYVFIVPYRDRIPHLTFFRKYMSYVMEDYDEDSYLILYVHQKNNLPFNRGAMKNMGFIFVKETYPEDYSSIILIFNDVDTVPYEKNLLNYDVSFGEIKHFYGFKFVLGGIVSIRARDFEQLNGFPNYWNWGFEDNELQRRALNEKMPINRSQFYTIDSMKILHFMDSMQKTIERRNIRKFSNPHYHEKDGIQSLEKYHYEYEAHTSMLHVTTFKSLYNPSDKIIYHNIMDGPTIRDSTRGTMCMKFK